VVYDSGPMNFTGFYTLGNFTLFPWSLLNCKKILTGFSRRDNLTLYAVHGGMPWLLSRLSSEKTVEENIMTLLRLHEKWFAHIFKDVPEDSVHDCAELMARIAGDVDYSGTIPDRLADVLTKTDLIVRKNPEEYPCKWKLRNRSLNFFFRFVYAFHVKNIQFVQGYLDREIMPYLEDFVLESWRDMIFGEYWGEPEKVGTEEIKEIIGFAGTDAGKN
ncbi:MAG: hypothetical protein MJ052_06140, partial [Sphaerochaetaceae bacterium]|nr:hypothetical protein [Sphaerochaetaceae bacterium]